MALPALIGTFGRAFLPQIGGAAGALLRGAGTVARNPFAQQIGASFVGSRLAQRGRLDLPDMGPVAGGARWRPGLRIRGGRRGGRGISAAQVRTTMRVLKTIKKLYSKLPKTSSRGGGRGYSPRRRYY